MSASSTQTVISISPDDLENLIRRVVREELVRLLRKPTHSLFDDREQEGEENPAEDKALLDEALAILREYGDKPEAWMDWKEFEAELDKAEPAGELPD